MIAGHVSGLRGISAVVKAIRANNVLRRALNVEAIMPNWNAVAQRVTPKSADEMRFVVWQFDPVTPGIKGPDGGKEHRGYTEIELRQILAEVYERPENVINSLIQIAKSQPSG